MQLRFFSIFFYYILNYFNNSIFEFTFSFILLLYVYHYFKVAGYEGKIKIGMDVAASEFFKNGKYDLDFKNEKSDPNTYLEPEALKNLYLDFVKEFPIVSIEDPFDQDDWSSWSSMTAATPIQIVGDDLTVTNPERFVIHQI